MTEEPVTVVGDLMGEYKAVVSEDGKVISLTRPVQENDWEWIDHLRRHYRDQEAPSMSVLSHYGRPTPGPDPFIPPAPPLRRIPCHPEHPIL